MDPKFEKWFTDDSDKGSGIFHRDWEVWQATLEAYGVKEMVEALKLALRYLDHPETKKIPFALPVLAVIERCNEALARAEEES